ncbi:MAG: hypothetical protein ACTHKU_10285 [Verrucomicrobiota bacterium]
MCALPNPVPVSPSFPAQVGQMLDSSIIVAAHPDDEVLWFSSVLAKVDRVIICFLESRSDPERGPGRRRSLSRHPIINLSCLEATEAGTFRSADWNNPKLTSFGLEILKATPREHYEANYFELSAKLRVQLDGCRNVFTHNPWGEYGNEEHVQVYRVIKELQKEMQFDLWFSNYCSNVSFKLMLNCISRCSPLYVTLRTDKALNETVKAIYMATKTWTWYEDWDCFLEEVFISDPPSSQEPKPYGPVFPVNLIKMNWPELECASQQRNTTKSISQRIASRIGRGRRLLTGHG